MVLLRALYILVPGITREERVYYLLKMSNAAMEPKLNLTGRIIENQKKFYY